MEIQAKEPMLTTEDAAEFLNLTTNTVRKYVQKGKLRPFKRIGRACLFLKSECVRYKRERKPRGNPTFSGGN